MSAEPGSRRMVCLVPELRQRLQEILGKEGAEAAELAGDDLVYKFESLPVEEKAAEDWGLPGSRQAEEARKHARKVLRDLETLNSQLPPMMKVSLEDRVLRARQEVEELDRRLKVDRRGNPLPEPWTMYLEAIFRAWLQIYGELPSLTRSEYVDGENEEDHYPQMRELVEAARLAHPYTAQTVPFDRVRRSLKAFRNPKPFRLTSFLNAPEG